ncbi:SCAN domain-containing protein 3-like [Hydractinia symbiolongicarpus]|uniref:SCAN domain-containing protein 3-like n=1 Tax=Hydractinia symbiolongicarpus TaxID=13093 RepID=UPI00254A77F0|nr:SCAN domain-containing protein 3-like [Hydractinia symbiolongicarpus]
MLLQRNIRHDITVSRISRDLRKFKWRLPFAHRRVDHFSKFRVLSPLDRKTAEERSKRFKDRFFSVFGLPKIIHSDNGREFVNGVMEHVAASWPGKTTFGHGAPGHSQSQGLVEQGNATIQTMISAKEMDTKTSFWSKWLPEIQFMSICSPTVVVSSIKKTPFKVVFGQKPNGLDQLDLATHWVEEDTSELIEIDETVDFSADQPNPRSETPFETTFPKRSTVREKVAAEIARNATMMTKKIF